MRLYVIQTVDGGRLHQKFHGLFLDTNVKVLIILCSLSFYYLTFDF